MVQRYVKFGNFRSPVAASFAALQKVRSAPPVTGFLSSTFCCSLSAVRCPLSAVRCPLSAVRCSLFAVCRSPFAACCLCLLFARRLLFATLRLPPQPAITTRRPQTAAARVDSSPANPLLSGYALNRSHMCAKRRSMLFCLASDVVETEFLFIFVQINKGKQLFIPLADRGTSSGDCLNRVWLLRFFAGNKAARSLFRGGVRRCITVGISDEIPVLPSRLDFRGGGCDLGVTDNILPGGFLFLPFVSERRVYRGVTLERSPTGVPSAAPFFRGRADGQYVTTY